MEKKIERFIKEKNILTRGDRVLVAVSGGADSMALLSFLINNREKYGIDIGAAHLHHDMRGTAADDDAAYVKAFCEKYAVPFYFEKQNVIDYAKTNKIGSEVAGRQLRYAFFDRVMQSEKYNLLATAHHGDDQAETVLMRLFRGTGIKGAAGILPKDRHIIRPLLCVTRKEIEGYCAENGIQFRHDSTNDDMSLTRNRLRHSVMPQIESVNEKAGIHIARFAEIAEEYERLLQEVVKEKKQRILIEENGEWFLDISRWSEEYHLVRTALIRELILSGVGTLIDIESGHIERLDRWIREKDGNWRMCLPGRIEVVRQYDKIKAFAVKEKNVSEEKKVIADEGVKTEITFGSYIFISEQIITENIRENLKKNPNEDLKLTQNSKKYVQVALEYDKINRDVVFRLRQPGDFIRLKGIKSGDIGQKTLKKFFIDKKIPKEIRDALPVLAMGSEILWMPGIAANPCYEANENTSRILRISMKNTENINGD